MKTTIAPLLLLCAMPLFARSWHKVPLKELAGGKYKLTHVETSGLVTLVKKEADGDTHIRLSDCDRFEACDGVPWIVAECIPELPCKAPKVGETITVRGISRFDGQHGWAEVHPVEQLTRH